MVGWPGLLLVMCLLAMVLPAGKGMVFGLAGAVGVGLTSAAVMLVCLLSGDLLIGVPAGFAMARCIRRVLWQWRLLQRLKAEGHWGGRGFEARRD